MSGAMPDLTLAEVREVFATREVVRIEGTQRAATALVLREEDDDLQALVIRRAKRRGDRWSGQMALPGGRLEKGDPDSRGAAERETREEVGIDLARHGTHLGRLDDLQAMAKGRRLTMVISPHVYRLDEPVEITINEEVETWVWVSLDPLRRGEHDGEIPWKYGLVGQLLPCFQVGPHCIWGLTYRMLCNFFEIMGRPIAAERRGLLYRKRG